MCQIQLIHKFDGKKLSPKDITQFKRLMLRGSETNDDAWGYYSIGDKRLSKHGGELEWNMMKEIEDVDTSTIFGHNRLATHGKADILENNHPFETENFIVLHNGVLSCHSDLKEVNKLDYSVETDSFIIPALIEKVYADLGDSYASIKAVAEVIYGSFSVLIFSKSDNRLFYLKDNSTGFHFGLARFKDGDVLIGSTKENNIDQLYNDNVRGDLFVKNLSNLVKGTPKAYHILEITSEGIYELDKFEEGSYYSARNSAWDSATAKFVKVDTPVKTTYPTKWDGKHNSLRTVSGQDKLVDISERSFDGYGHPITKDKVEVKADEWIKSCTDALDYVCGDMSAYLLKYFQVNVQHDKKNVFQQQTKLILDRQLKEAEKREVNNNYSNYGSIKFNERVKSKITEIIVTINDYMLDGKLPVINS